MNLSMRGSVVCKNVNEKKMSDKDDETENNLRLSISEVRQARKDLLYSVTKKSLGKIIMVCIQHCFNCKLSKVNGCNTKMVHF